MIPQINRFSVRPHKVNSLLLVPRPRWFWGKVKKKKEKEKKKRGGMLINRTATARMEEAERFRVVADDNHRV